MPVTQTLGQLRGGVPEIRGMDEENGKLVGESSQLPEMAAGLAEKSVTDADRGTDFTLTMAATGELGVVADYDHHESRKLWTGEAITAALIIDLAGAVNGVLDVIVTVRNESPGTISVSMTATPLSQPDLSICLSGSLANEDGTNLCDECSIEVKDLDGNDITFTLEVSVCRAASLKRHSFVVSDPESSLTSERATTPMIERPPSPRACSVVPVGLVCAVS